MPWQGLLHFLSVLLASLLARFAVFDIVQFVSSARPTEGALLGSLLLVAAGGLTPLVWKCYPSSLVRIILWYLCPGQGCNPNE